jgi:hypothetical protein
LFIENRENGFFTEINEKLMENRISSLNEHSRERVKGTYFLLTTGENGLEMPQFMKNKCVCAFFVLVLGGNYAITMHKMLVGVAN